MLTDEDALKAANMLRELMAQGVPHDEAQARVTQWASERVHELEMARIERDKRMHKAPWKWGYFGIHLLFDGTIAVVTLGIMTALGLPLGMFFSTSMLALFIVLTRAFGAMFE